MINLPPKSDPPKEEPKPENVEKETFTLEDVIKSLKTSLKEAGTNHPVKKYQK